MLLIQKKELQAACKGMEKTIKTVTKNPFTKCIRLKSNSDKLSMYTTNTEMYQKKQVKPHRISKDFDACFDFKKFEKLLKISKSETIGITTNGGTCYIFEDKAISDNHIDSDNFTWSLENRSDFPELVSINTENAIEINSNIISDLQKIVWLASKSGRTADSYLRMINFHNNEISTVNGYRGLILQQNLSINFGESHSVDRTFIDACISVFKENEGLIRIGRDNNVFYMGTDDHMLVCEIKYDIFPTEWKNILNNESIEFKVDGKKFIQVLQKILITAEDNNESECTIRVTNNTIEVSSSHKVNVAKDSIDIIDPPENIPDIALNINCESLLDGVKKIQNGVITIKFINSESPIIIECNPIKYIQNILRS